MSATGAPADKTGACSGIQNPTEVMKGASEMRAAMATAMQDFPSLTERLTRAMVMVRVRPCVVPHPMSLIDAALIQLGPTQFACIRTLKLPTLLHASMMFMDKNSVAQWRPLRPSLQIRTAVAPLLPAELAMMPLHIQRTPSTGRTKRTATLHEIAGLLVLHL